MVPAKTAPSSYTRQSIHHFQDPVEAYDSVATEYARLIESRLAYLNAIDELIQARIPPGSRSLLDVGAGDGRRALRIGHKLSMQEIVLLEPSAGMRNLFAENAETWQMRAEELDPTKPPAAGRRFDVITCLWNVLGHIPTHALRIRALSQLRPLLTPSGILFIDVNHRYNARRYGWPRTAVRFLRDRLQPSERSGDVTAKWTLPGATCSTYGHVFTTRELRQLAVASHLNVEELIAVDYETGSTVQHSFLGNLLWILKP